LFFRIFSAENGFEIKKIFLVVNEPGDYWFEIPDPKSVKKRIIFENSKQSYLFILARRTAIKEIFTHTPQQSDYEHLAWEGKEQFARTKKSLSQRIFFFLPDHVKKGIRRKLRILDPKAWKVFLRDTGNGNKEEFKRTQNY
jgi:hypothetical protein